MDNTDKKKQQILGILEQGLSYLGESIAEENSCNLRISTGRGNVLYERNCIDDGEPGDNFGKLTYTVETHEGPIKLTLRGLPPDKLEQGMNSLKETEFAVQCYFSRVNRSKQLDSLMKKGVVKYILNERINRATFLDIVNTHCNPDCQYYVSILNDCTKNEQRFMAKNLKRNQTFNISILDSKNLVLIVQHTFNPLTNTIDVNSPTEAEQQDIFSHLVAEYNGCPKFATGCSGYPGDLYLSYQQAIFTMSYMKLTGHTAFTTRYSDLGLGIPLTSNNWVEIKKYCLKNLSPLLEADKLNNASYFETLNTYLDYNCNGKEAADRLYIHVNTLYYRLKKIESMLNVSTTDMCDIAHLYYVTKIYKALIDSGIMDEE